MERTSVQKTGLRRVMSMTLTLALSVGTLAALPVQPAQAAPQAITMQVVSARDEPLAFDGAGVSAGDPVTAYKFIINEDNTGTTVQRETAPDCTPENPDYALGDANPCDWASIAGLASSSPVVTQGDESILSTTQSLDLEPGRYLISVLADGYKLDGLHFSIPRTNSELRVELQPTPLPTATIQAQVFADLTEANGQFDPGEDGLAGFQGTIADTLGMITTDVFGNPLCTEYEPGTGPNGYEWVDGGPVPVPNTGGECLSDATGLLTIPNLGTNRYALSVSPPNGQSWIQTTTLEGNHDWDAWVMEGATGVDTEFTVAGEPLPNIIFGYVPGPAVGSPGYHAPAAGMPAYWRDPALPAGTGKITGVVDAIKTYVPFTGGMSWPAGNTGGVGGSKIDGPIKNPWLVLNDLERGDTAVWIGQGNASGAFSIANLPPGNYSLTWWDGPQNYLLDLMNVTVGPGGGGQGETVDMGILPLAGWWATFDGYVFNDTDRDGIKDPGEPGIANYGLTLRRRDNSLMDRGSTSVSTNNAGYYKFEGAYPLTQWVVMEAYNDLYYTTGVTYQADNQPDPTTVLGAGVDVSVLPIIGLGGRMDWGVHSYDRNNVTNGLDPRNGGIVGTVSYDTTRNELDPALAAVEDWQPGVSGLTVDLYQPVACGTNAGAPCDANGDYELDSNGGSYVLGQRINTYTTETWERPTGCVARNVDGDPLLYPQDQQVLPTDPAAECLEGPLMGTQFQTGFSSVDGNYGFGDGCFGAGNEAIDEGVCASGDDPTPLPAGDYLVKVEIPDDSYGRALYNFTREEDINIGNGDDFIPQAPPPACAGSLHTVDVAGDPTGNDNYGPATIEDPSGNGGGDITVPASEPTVNDTFANDVGGSPFEGMQKPICDTKLVPLANGRSIVPTFNVFTDVPVPGRFFGYMVDDLNFSTDPTSLLYGEKAGIPFAPIGIYDYTNRLVTTVESDANGVYDVLLPSTNRINCPTPSGVCGNVYRFVGNDPGIPGRLNPNYNSQFRTLAAEFESIPGVVIPADNAPTQVGVSVQLPGSQFNQFLTCPLNDPAAAPTTPELWAVSKPYADLRGGSPDSFTIDGQGFGTGGTVTLDGTVVLPTTSWSDTHIAVTVPTTTAGGVHQLAIKRTSNGRSTVNGLTFHVLTASVVGAFPSNTVVDNFNRANTTNGFAGGWSDDAPSTYFNVNANQARVRTGAGNTGNAWRSSGSAFGTNQEAYFTFTQPSNQSGANEQGLLLKFNGSAPGNSSSSWIEVATNNSPANTVRIRTKSSGSGTITTRATLTGVTFATGDRLGARALADGTILVYKNGTQVGSTTFATSGSWTGRIGVRFEGTGPTTATEARFDDFGGGNVSVTPGYSPNVYEVGPGRTYDPGLFVANNPSHAIQDAIDDAAASTGPDLVVVYPGTPQGDRINPRGAYYENLIIDTPIKLQGVGPGGVYANGTPVSGSVIDAGAFGGDTVLADAWRVKLESMTWVGNQNVYEGQGIYLLARNTTQFDGQYLGQTYKAAVDGFELRGGDQMGFPNNINESGGGGPTGLPPNVVTQGGAIFANDYVQNLQITNNLVRNNGGSYGTIRVGTPDLPDNQTDDLKILNNRIVANGGTNLAGAIGIFAGTERYEVARNDICGNFSAEYGGGVSVYGKSVNGNIHHNRIYYNRSFDEGAGIMIAGELPADPSILSPGSGPVDINNNLIQGNLGDGDGGGIRFLMAGNYVMNVTNNMIVNNVSSHEGGGVSMNDAPNVRIVNNTIMKNITTATAVDSNGQPMPAGLSTSANSALLQATLPGGSSTFSNPVLFNNIFWDNRAGAQAGGTVTGIGVSGDPTPVNHWDMGVADGSGSLSPTNSMMQVATGTNPSGTNQVGVDPQVVAGFDTTLAFAPWRGNVNFVGTILVALNLPPTLLTGDYHIPSNSTAKDAGASTKGTVAAPTTDFDADARPAGSAFDIGADEVAGPPVSAFPRTGVLDSFTRANGPLGTPWAGNVSTTTVYGIESNAVRVSGTGNAWWNTAAKFGGNQEAFFTFTQVSSVATEQGLLLKFLGGDPDGASATWIEVARVAGGVVVKTKNAGSIVQRGGLIAATFAAGDQLGARTLTDGTVLVYKNGVQIGSTNVTSGANPWPTSLATGNGRIGVRFLGATAANSARFDNFGGGTMP